MLKISYLKNEYSICTCIKSRTSLKINAFTRLNKNILLLFSTLNFRFSPKIDRTKTILRRSTKKFKFIV